MQGQAGEQREGKGKPRGRPVKESGRDGHKVETDVKKGNKQRLAPLFLSLSLSSLNEPRHNITFVEIVDLQRLIAISQSVCRWLNAIFPPPCISAQRGQVESLGLNEMKVTEGDQRLPKMTTLSWKFNKHLRCSNLPCGTE